MCLILIQIHKELFERMSWKKHRIKQVVCLIKGLCKMVAQL